MKHLFSYVLVLSTFSFSMAKAEDPTNTIDSPARALQAGGAVAVAGGVAYGSIALGEERRANSAIKMYQSGESFAKQGVRHWQRVLEGDKARYLDDRLFHGRPRADFDPELVARWEQNFEDLDTTKNLRGFIDMKLRHQADSRAMKDGAIHSRGRARVQNLKVLGPVIAAGVGAIAVGSMIAPQGSPAVQSSGFQKKAAPASSEAFADQGTDTSLKAD